ncbi:MAG TPA: POTRA domain-containing protein, partial [Dongiaceae bacterium]|nr:POTRA domain-containing protein [Dongiaceae bacterium]
MAPQILNRQRRALRFLRDGARRRDMDRNSTKRMLLCLALLPLLLLSPLLRAEPSIKVNLVDAADDAGLEKNIKNHISRLGFATGADARRLRMLIEKNARTALEAFGYYEAQITTEIDGDDDDATVHV